MGRFQHRLGFIGGARIGSWALAVAVAVAAVGATSAARADPAVADASWANAAGGTWTEGANWSSNPDHPSGVGAVARIPSNQTANRAFLLGSNITLGALHIDNATNRTNSIGVLDEDTPVLTFDAVGTGPATLTITGNSSGNATPNNLFAAVVLNDDLTISVDRTSSTSAAGTLTLRRGPITGVGGITKTGPGTLTLADNPKAYTGATVVNEGRLRINVPAGRPSGTSGVFVNGAGQLDLAGVGRYSFGPAGTNVTLNGMGPPNNFPLTFGGTIRVDGAGDNEITNEIVLQSDSSIHVQGAANVTRLSNVVSGPGRLTLPLPGSDGNIGTLVLAGANTFAGGTVINDGTVTAEGASALGATTGPLAVNNQNATQPGKNVVLNLSPSAATTTGSLSGTIATPTGGVNTVTINNDGPSLTLNQTTPGTYAGVIAGPGAFGLGTLSTAPLTLAGTNTYTGATTVAGGTLRVTGSIADSSGVTIEAGGTLDVATPQRLQSLAVNPGGVAIVSGAAVTVGTGATATPLTITGTGRLDLRNRAMVVDHAPGDDATPLRAVRAALVGGYAGGSWAGNGIPSTDAAADSSRALGYALAGEVVALAGDAGVFRGQPVDGSAVVVRHTLYGDATLDGAVNFDDLVRLAQNYNTNLAAVTDSTWFNGDFTYDNAVDFNDLVKLAQNYNTALPAGAVPGAPADFAADLAAAFAAVPEPSCGIPGLVVAAGLARRRGR